MYTSVPLTRVRPGLIVFLVDRSGAASASSGDLAVAWATQRGFDGIVKACFSGAGVQRRCQVLVVGYGADHAEVEFSGWADEVRGPRRLEWKIAGGARSLHRGLEVARDHIVKNWLPLFKTGFPPVVIHLAAGEPESPVKAAAEMGKLTSLSTSDGNVLLFNVQIPTRSDLEVIFPTVAPAEPADAFALAHSSRLPDSLAEIARSVGLDVAGAALGVVISASKDKLEKVLSILSQLANPSVTLASAAPEPVVEAEKQPVAPPPPPAEKNPEPAPEPEAKESPPPAAPPPKPAPAAAPAVSEAPPPPAPAEAARPAAKNPPPRGSRRWIAWALPAAAIIAAAAWWFHRKAVPAEEKMPQTQMEIPLETPERVAPNDPLAEIETEQDEITSSLEGASTYMKRLATDAQASTAERQATDGLETLAELVKSAKLIDANAVHLARVQVSGASATTKARLKLVLTEQLQPRYDSILDRVSPYAESLATEGKPQLLQAVQSLRGWGAADPSGKAAIQDRIARLESEAVTALAQ